jgi:hypothetical protein
VFTRRVTIFVGHFGSGKTEIALNAALRAAEGGAAVALVDLDIVKPYFRSRSARAFMAAAGVRVVAPEGDHIHADLPIIVPQIRTLLRDAQRRVIFDVGGDDTGARALGSLADVVPRAETDHLLVLNFRRPFTETVEAAVEMVREIEAAARLPVSGLISNTHLMGETTAAVVLEGYRLADETARRLGIPLMAVGADEATRQLLHEEELSCPVFALRRLIRPPFESRRYRPTIGPLFALT